MLAIKPRLLQRHRSKKPRKGRVGATAREWAATVRAARSKLRRQAAVIVDEIQLNRETLSLANGSSGQLRIELDRASTIIGSEEAAINILKQALSASDHTQIDSPWDGFVTISSAGVDQALSDLTVNSVHGEYAVSASGRSTVRA